MGLTIQCHRLFEYMYYYDEFAHFLKHSKNILSGFDRKLQGS